MRTNRVYTNANGLCLPSVHQPLLPDELVRSNISHNLKNIEGNDTNTGESIVNSDDEIDNK